MSESNKNKKTPDELLQERLKQSANKRKKALSRIDVEFEDDKKSVTMSNSNTKKQKTMKFDNPYNNMPNANPASEEDYTQNKGSEDVIEYTQKDIDNARYKLSFEEDSDKKQETDGEVDAKVLDRDIPNHPEGDKAKQDDVKKDISGNGDRTQEEVGSQVDNETSKVVSDKNQEKIDESGENELADKLKQDKEWDGARLRAKMEQLQSKLDEARDVFVTRKRRTETLGTKLKSLLGRVDIGNANAEIKQFEDNYNKALADVRDLLLQERDAEGTSDERKKEINAELKFMAVNEGIALNEAETKAKLETKWGQKEELVKKVGMWYKGLSKGVKYTMAGVLIVVGGTLAVTSGATGVGGGLFILAKGGKRALGAVATGVGVSMGLETRAKSKRDAQMAEAMKKFSELSPEEQKAIVDGMNNFDEETHKEFEKIRSQRRKIKLVAVTTAASLLALGTWATAHDIDKFGAGGHHPDVEGAQPSPEVMSQISELASHNSDIDFSRLGHGVYDEETLKNTRAYKMFQMKYGEEAHEKFLKDALKKGGKLDELEGRWQRHVDRHMHAYEERMNGEVVRNNAMEIAKKMGINPEGAKFEAEGGVVPVKINGKPVPEELLTEKQQIFLRRIRRARDLNPVADINESASNLHQTHSAGVHEGPGTPWLEHEDELMEGGKPVLENDRALDDATVQAAMGGEVDAGEMDVAEHGLGTENGPSDVVKNVISKEGMRDWEKMSGGVNKYGITAQQLQNARELPTSDRDKMEEYLIKLAKSHTDESTGDVNKELLRREVDKAFGQYQLTGKIPEMPKMDTDISSSDTGFESYADNDALNSQAEAQSVASESVDNPLSEGFNNIELDANNIGHLTVEKGSSLEGTLMKFLEANHDKLTEGGMGWDPDKYKDVHEWAGKRAHGLMKEFAQTHKGIDLDRVQPGTELNLDLSNPADIKVDVNFEGGPHIVPESVKTEIPHEDVLERITDNSEILKAFNITDEQFAAIKDEPVSNILNRTISKDPANWTSLEKVLMDYFLYNNNGPKPTVAYNMTVGEFLQDNASIKILKETVENANSAHNPIPDVAGATGEVSGGQPEVLVNNGEAWSEKQPDGLDTGNGGNSKVWDETIDGKNVDKVLYEQIMNKNELGIVQEISSNPELKATLTKQVQSVFNVPANSLANVVNEPIDSYLSPDYGDEQLQSRLMGVINRANETLGDKAIDPHGKKVSTYFVRTFARALKEGKVKEVFPSADF